MAHKRKIQSLLVWLFIFTVPLAWAKDSLLAPVFWEVVCGEFHEISLDFEHGELHFTLHHAEDYKFGAEAKHSHGYDVLADEHHFNNSGHHHRFDHKFHMSASAMQMIASQRNVVNYEAHEPVILSLKPPVFGETTLISIKPLIRPHSVARPAYPHIRTTVLLI